MTRRARRRAPSATAPSAAAASPSRFEVQQARQALQQVVTIGVASPTWFTSGSARIFARSNTL